MELNELKFLKEMMQMDKDSVFFSEEEWEIFLKVYMKKAKKLYTDMCKDENICPYCGDPIKTDGKMAVNGTYNHPHSRVVIVSMCPDRDCQYNKQLAQRLQKAFEDYTSKYTSAKSSFSELPGGQLFFKEW